MPRWFQRVVLSRVWLSFAVLGLSFFIFGVGILVAAGVPIAFAFGIATAGYVALATRAPLTVIVSRMDEGMSHLLLLSIPLFVFLGILIDMTGMARAMVGFLASLLGHVRGGLSYVLLGAMYLVSGISGAKAADMAAVAPVLAAGSEPVFGLAAHTRAGLSASLVPAAQLAALAAAESMERLPPVGHVARAHAQSAFHAA